MYKGISRRHQTYFFSLTVNALISDVNVSFICRCLLGVTFKKLQFFELLRWLHIFPKESCFVSQSHSHGSIILDLLIEMSQHYPEAVYNTYELCLRTKQNPCAPLKHKSVTAGLTCLG